MSPRARKHQRDVTVTIAVDDDRYGAGKRLVVRSTFPYDWDHAYGEHYLRLDGAVPRIAEPISMYLPGPIAARVEDRPDAEEIGRLLTDEARRIVREEGLAG